MPLLLPNPKLKRQLARQCGIYMHALLFGLTSIVVTAAPAITSVQGDLPAQPAGRLFFTPEEREMFDKGGKIAGVAGGSTVSSSAPRFDGMVSTHGRAPILWVNGKILTSIDRKAGEFEVEQLIGQTLTLKDKKRTVRLKPGQRFDEGTGAVREIGQ